MLLDRDVGDGYFNIGRTTVTVHLIRRGSAKRKSNLVTDISISALQYGLKTYSKLKRSICIRMHTTLSIDAYDDPDRLV